MVSIPEFVSVNPSVGEGAVRQVEENLGFSLPGEYREFLMCTNGGALAERFVIQRVGPTAILEVLYGASEVLEFRGVGFNEVIPDDYLAIGDGAGGALCVRIGEGGGSIWWADFDKADEIGAEGPAEEVMVRLADDLDEFLQIIERDQQANG